MLRQPGTHIGMRHRIDGGEKTRTRGILQQQCVRIRLERVVQPRQRSHADTRQDEAAQRREPVDSETQLRNNARHCTGCEIRNQHSHAARQRVQCLQGEMIGVLMRDDHRVERLEPCEVEPSSRPHRQPRGSVAYAFEDRIQQESASFVFEVPTLMTEEGDTHSSDASAQTSAGHETSRLVPTLIVRHPT